MEVALLLLENMGRGSTVQCVLWEERPPQAGALLCFGLVLKAKGALGSRDPKDL